MCKETTLLIKDAGEENPPKTTFASVVKLTHNGNTYFFRPSARNLQIIQSLGVLHRYRTVRFYNPNIASIPINVRKRINDLPLPRVEYHNPYGHPDESRKFSTIWFNFSDNDGSDVPIVFMIPGLGEALRKGGSIYRIGKTVCHTLGWRYVVVEPSPNFVASRFHTDDVKTVVNLLQKRFPKAPLYAVGNSLGGMTLMRYLVESGSSCPLTGAMTISSALNFKTAVKKLEGSSAKLQVISRLLTNRCISCLRKNKNLFKQKPNFDYYLAKSSTRLSTFLETFCPLVGVANLSSLFEHASLETSLIKVKTPTLFLVAKDDPLIHPEVRAADKAAAIKCGSLIYMEVPKGGHSGFQQVGSDTSYMQEVLLTYLNALKVNRSS